MQLVQVLLVLVCISSEPHVNERLTFSKRILSLPIDKSIYDRHYRGATPQRRAQISVLRLVEGIGGV